MTLIAGAGRPNPAERDAVNPFPGVIGSGAFAHTPPPIISIPRNPLSPAMRDRLAQAGAPMPTSSAAVKPRAPRRTRRLGIAASGLGAAFAVAALLAAVVGLPWGQRPSSVTGGPGDGTPPGTPAGGIAFLPGDGSGDRSPGTSPDGSVIPGTGMAGGDEGPVAATATPLPTAEPARHQGSGGGSGGRPTSAPDHGPTPRPTDPPTRSTPTPAPRTPGPTTAPEATPSPDPATPPPPTPPPPTPSPVPTATPKPPAVDFTVQVSGLTVRTTNHTRWATSWTWSFGDGTASTARSPSHAYGSPGTYAITLTATGGTGATASHTEVVVVGG